MDEELKPEDIHGKGFLDLCNVLNRHKEKVTLSDLIREVTEEGWYDDLMRLGYNTIIRQVNRHNRKYKNAIIHPYSTDL